MNPKVQIHNSQETRLKFRKNEKFSYSVDRESYPNIYILKCDNSYIPMTELDKVSRVSISLQQPEAI